MQEQPKNIFRNYCKDNNLRFTPERGVIIDEIYRSCSHFDVDQLFVRIRNRYPNLKIARGSIYRTMPVLIESGLIREALIDNGKVSYEHTLGHEHHDHLKCMGCGKIFEFFDKEIDYKQEEICKKKNFKIVSHLHVILGYCSECQNQGKGKK